MCANEKKLDKNRIGSALFRKLIVQGLIEVNVFDKWDGNAFVQELRIYSPDSSVPIILNEKEKKWVVDNLYYLKTKTTITYSKSWPKFEK